MARLQSLAKGWLAATREKMKIPLELSSEWFPTTRATPSDTEGANFLLATTFSQKATRHIYRLPSKELSSIPQEHNNSLIYLSCFCKQKLDEIPDVFHTSTLIRCDK